MINEKLLNMLIRKVKDGKIALEDIKDENYKTEVESKLKND